MKHWDLSTGTGRLELALQALGRTKGDVAESWDDDASRRFQETFVEPLEPRIRTLLDAPGRLAEVLASAERQCRDQDHD